MARTYTKEELIELYEIESEVISRIPNKELHGDSWITGIVKYIFAYGETKKTNGK